MGGVSIYQLLLGRLECYQGVPEGGLQVYFDSLIRASRWESSVLITDEKQPQGFQLNRRPFPSHFTNGRRSRKSEQTNFQILVCRDREQIRQQSPRCFERKLSYAEALDHFLVSQKRVWGGASKLYCPPFNLYYRCQWGVLWWLAGAPQRPLSQLQYSGTAHDFSRLTWGDIRDWLLLWSPRIPEVPDYPADIQFSESLPQRNIRKTAV